MIFGQTKFRLGISSWTFPWAVGVYGEARPEPKLSAVGLLEKAVSIGVTLVQFADNLPLEKLSDKELGELKAFADLNGISIEAGTKGIDIPHLLKMLEIAKYLKSPILRILPALFGRKAEMSEVEKNILTVIPEFEKAGIVLVLENTEAFLASEYVDLVNRINHPYFRLCVDLANAIGRFEGPFYVMDKFAPYCGNFHFKDVKITRSQTLMGFSVEGTPSGQGAIPLDYAISQLKRNNLYPSVIIELWPPKLDTLSGTVIGEEAMARESVRFMMDYLDTK